MWIRYMLLMFAAFIAGMSVAGAFVAFIALIGILPALTRQERFFGMEAGGPVSRLVKAWPLPKKQKDQPGLAKVLYIYETLTICGVFIGTLLSLFEPELKLGRSALFCFVFLGGMFDGCLVGALEETLNVYPIVSRRTKIRHGMGYLLVAVAAGKSIGALIYFFVLKLS